jgi:hypothetical protein
MRLLITGPGQLLPGEIGVREPGHIHEVYAEYMVENVLSAS